MTKEQAAALRSGDQVYVYLAAFTASPAFAIDPNRALLCRVRDMSGGRVYVIREDTHDGLYVSPVFIARKVSE